MAGGRIWTIQEDEILKQMIGQYALERIAKKLNRTTNAVYTRLQVKRNAHLKSHTGLYTINDIAKATSIDWKSIKKHIDKGDLKTTRKKLHKKLFYMIAGKDFWKWAENNEKLLNFKNIKKNAIIPEPEWAEEKRKEETKPIKKQKPWTKEEEQQLIRFVKAGFNYQEISEKLNRNYGGITHKISRLNINPRILIKWTDEEVKFILDNENKLSDKEIAWELGREEVHVRWKRQHLKNKGEYHGRKKLIQNKVQTVSSL
jgi:hypothetical protein